MATPDCFPIDYAAGRQKFIEAAQAAGAEVTLYQNPLRGPAGERLFTDVAWLGPRDAPKVFVSMSGTHGAEGFAGSAVQIGSLQEGLYQSVLADVAVMLVHVVNPYGFAWLRRANEDGVDVCRNFINFNEPLPRNPLYDVLADVLVPDSWVGESRKQADEKLLSYLAEHGMDNVKAQLPRGQYDYWFAPFFGGTAPTWSNRTFRQIVRTFLGEARHVAAIDYHTGLGEYGQGELLCFQERGGEAHERAASWWGKKLVSVFADGSVAYEVTGGILEALEMELSGKRVTAAAYEFGTRDLMAVLGALRGDHWLHAHGDLSSALAREIKEAVRDAFYCDRDDWREMVWEQSVQAEREAVSGLASG